MQTRLVKNAQRKQTVFLHRGIYRWTNFLIRHSPSHKRSMFLPWKFLLYFFFFIKKISFFQTRCSTYIYIYNSIKHFNFTFSPYIHMLFSKLFQKIPKIPRSISCIFFLFFIFLQRSRYSILKRFSMSLNLDTISSSIFSLVSRSREGEKRTKPGNLGTWRVGSGGVSLAPPLPSSLPRFARCWPYAFLPRSRCCTWLELG